MSSVLDRLNAIERTLLLSISKESGDMLHNDNMQMGMMLGAYVDKLRDMDETIRLLREKLNKVELDKMEKNIIALQEGQEVLKQRLNEVITYIGSR